MRKQTEIIHQIDKLKKVLKRHEPLIELREDKVIGHQKVVISYLTIMITISTLEWAAGREEERKKWKGRIEEWKGKDMELYF